METGFKTDKTAEQQQWKQQPSPSNEGTQSKCSARKKPVKPALKKGGITLQHSVEAPNARIASCKIRFWNPTEPFLLDLRRRSLLRHVVVHSSNNPVFHTGNPANGVTLQGPQDGYYTSARKALFFCFGARKSISMRSMQLFIDRGHSFERLKKLFSHPMHSITLPQGLGLTLLIYESVYDKEMFISILSVTYV